MKHNASKEKKETTKLTDKALDKILYKGKNKKHKEAY